MELKAYQKALLAALETFLARSQEMLPAAAYAEITAEEALRTRLGRYARPYRPPANLADVPYVCLRLPTGGGKTLMAAHAVRVIRDVDPGGAWPLVLWLVTSKAIREQTSDALKNPRHPYRKALDDIFGGRVRVFDIGDFTQVRPQDLDQNACVVVATVQALKVDDTEGRKVYRHHEELEGHFARIPKARLDAEPGLERDEHGAVKFSFANLLHLNRPAMIVDEAHNVVTGLSDVMRARLNPSCVIEFTATPAGRSNILFNATAAELKAEAMIKLPIVLQEHAGWQAAVAATVAERETLAKLAAGERDYIRPIALYQAEPKDREATVEAVKRELIENLGVSEAAIAVATGDQRGLDGVDLSARECPIEHVITVQALKEGWDCPFAYVFCSVQRLSAGGAVEQLLGRVLRMPYATRRANPLLNKAYAHVSEPEFYAAATALRDQLVAKMGFEDAAEAEAAIERPELPFAGGGVGAPETPPFVLDDTPEVRAALVAAGAPVRVAEGGGLTVTRETLARPGVAERVLAAAPGGAVALKARMTEAGLAPATRGEVLRVPRLMTTVQGELIPADLEEIVALFDWRLSGESADVPGLTEALNETVHRFEIDVQGNQVRSVVLGREPDLFAGAPAPETWTEARLAAQLDGLTRQADVTQSDLIGWLTPVISRLTGAGLSLAQLFRMKQTLARRLRRRIDELREARRATLAQTWLLAPTAPVSTLANEAFEFKAGMYDDQPTYRGPFTFNRHFLERVPAFDGKPDGEEARCARALDALGEVKWWVRNVARHPASFWLQTSKDRTYPDFVAELTDGRVFIVEYKGAQGWTDAAEDRAIGAAWERAGGGLYLMARERDDQGRDVLGQLTAKLGR